MHMRNTKSKNIYERCVMGCDTERIHIVFLSQPQCPEDVSLSMAMTALRGARPGRSHPSSHYTSWRTGPKKLPLALWTASFHQCGLLWPHFISFWASEGKGMRHWRWQGIGRVPAGSREKSRVEISLEKKQKKTALVPFLRAPHLAAATRRCWTQKSSWRVLATSCWNVQPKEGRVAKTAWRVQRGRGKAEERAPNNLILQSGVSRKCPHSPFTSSSAT